MSNENDSKLNVAMFDSGADLSCHRADVSQLDSSTNITVDRPAPVRMFGESEDRSVVGLAGFNFLTQAGIVADLLKTAERVLSKPCPSRLQELENALRTFERFTAPVAYGVDDVPDANNKLSEEDKLDVLNVFAAEYEVKDSDWEALHYIVNKTHGE